MRSRKSQRLSLMLRLAITYRRRGITYLIYRATQATCKSAPDQMLALLGAKVLLSFFLSSVSSIVGSTPLPRSLARNSVPNL